MSKTLHIVFQTHWDREWYETYETFRHRLIHVLRRVILALDQAEISTFILDGQTLPLIDYLEVAESHEKEALLNYIKQGKIVIGPWYIAADEFLVDGESLIRNLEMGFNQAMQYGAVQRLGYIPDTFGHIGQMPQILADFDIEDAMMWRGVLPQKDAFIWQGIDGTKLFSVFLSEGYYQPILNQKDYVDATKAYIDKVSKIATTDHLLLTAGGDHIMPTHHNIEKRLTILQDAIKDVDIKITDYQSYIASQKTNIDPSGIEIITGELRSNAHAYILPNVLSTRSYLKINNQQLEDDMLGCIEPMVAIRYLDRIDAPLKYIDSIWSLILQNQPHDSICGCSIDPVHQDNETRFRWAKERIKALTEGVFETTNGLPMRFDEQSPKHIYDDDTTFSLLNPHPYVFNGDVTCALYLHDNHAFKDGFMIKNIKTQAIYPVDLISCHQDRMFKSPLEHPPGFRKGMRYEIKAHVSLNPTSMTDFVLVEGHFGQHQTSTTHQIENDHMIVTLHSDGTLDLFDRQAQKHYPGIHSFESSVDCGDTYNYSKPDFDILTKAAIKGEPLVDIHEQSQSLRYQLIIKASKGLDASRKALLQDEGCINIDVTLTLGRHDRHVDVKTIIDNQISDQRLRIAYPLGERIEKTISDSAFELVIRQANRMESFVADRGKEVPVVVDPSLSMIIASGIQTSLWIGHRGMHAYQVVETQKESTLYHTILRSVGYLSHDDFTSRGGAAGPNMKTPDAQCLRQTTFDYQIGIMGKEERIIDVYQTIRQWRRPIQKFSALSLDQSGQSLIHFANKHVVMTAMRYIQSHHIEIRLWNASNEAQDVRLQSDHFIHEQIETNMRKAYEKTHNDVIEMRPHEIKTIQIRYKKAVNM